MNSEWSSGKKWWLDGLRSLIVSVTVFGVASWVGVRYLAQREARRDVKALVARARFDNRHRLLLEFREESHRIFWHATYWLRDDAKSDGQMTKEGFKEVVRRLGILTILMEDEKPEDPLVIEAVERFRMELGNLCELVITADKADTRKMADRDKWWRVYLDARAELAERYKDFSEKHVMASYVQ